MKIANGTNPVESTKKSARQIGLLAGKAKVGFRHDFVMTDEELLVANNPKNTDEGQQVPQLKGETD